MNAFLAWYKIQEIRKMKVPLYEYAVQLLKPMANMKLLLGHKQYR